MATQRPPAPAQQQLPGIPAAHAKYFRKSPTPAIDTETVPTVAGVINLGALARRMADRDAKRTEANVQSDLHALLLAAPLELEEGNLNDIVLEQQAGGQRRIDVEAGLCVFEVKRDLRKEVVYRNAIKQLCGYVEARTKAMQQRYVGVLTDGADWHLFHLVDGELKKVSAFVLDATRPDVDGLMLWLESVLATADKINPTPKEIAGRLGATSPSHALDYTDLLTLYEKGRNVPAVRLKRELWARLLTSAFGTTFTNSDELFVDHTLLVIASEVIAHAVIGIDPTAQDVTARSLLSGDLFSTAQVHGVVESDFFDWLLEVPGGDVFVKGLARRLYRFAWHEVEHDVLKVLYESVISQDQRKSLGEYYTPDWLADRVVDECFTEPMQQRLLDPACGSGTFLFHAIRKYITESEAKGSSVPDMLVGLTHHVVGMDIHPVAVTLARVTYLLAIGMKRLAHEDRPQLSIPVYLGDSIQWGKEHTVFTANALVVPTVDSGQLFASELRFPASACADAAQFDLMVNELADLASRKRQPRGPIPKLASIFKRFSVPDQDQPTITQTFKTMCDLHDQGRDHIWGYYVRNLARPFWLARDPNRVDVLVGNPPWLAYKHMTGEMQSEFKKLSDQRGLLGRAAVAPHQDLSALFVLRSVERYLMDGGKFGFVMPLACLSRHQFTGFRKGRYDVADEGKLTLQFGEPWDMHGVKPAFFPVPAAVVFGRRDDKGKPTPLPSRAIAWQGKLPQVNVGWLAACGLMKGHDEMTRADDLAAQGRSPYRARFSQGAVLVPRFLLVVERGSAGPLGAGAGRVAVTSRRSKNEKVPWKSMPSLSGGVERKFVRPMYMGDSLMPYRLLAPMNTVVPLSGKLLRTPDDRTMYPGLADWWSRAESAWNKGKKKKSKLSLVDQIDYMKKLSNQVPIVEGTFRVIYNKSGMYLTAAIVQDDAIIDHKLYWGATKSLDEARYLEAILNADVVTQRLRPLQGRGEHNPRDYDLYVWQMPIPAFDPKNARHQALVDLATKAEKLAASVILPKGKKFETCRKVIRKFIASTAVGEEIEKQVTDLLDGK